jgi:hypothetical protein
LDSEKRADHCGFLIGSNDFSPHQGVSRSKNILSHCHIVTLTNCHINTLSHYSKLPSASHQNTLPISQDSIPSIPHLLLME